MKGYSIRNNRTLYLVILIIVIILVSTLSIAYALLSSTLVINGTHEVVASNWDVHFDNILVDAKSVNASKRPVLSDSKTLDFNVVLDEPGDYYKFTVDIVNDGTIDAMIDSIVKMPDLTSEQAKYIRYEIEYSDGNSINDKQLLGKGSKKSLLVKVSYRNDISASELPSSDTTLNLSLTLVYTQSNNSSISVPNVNFNGNNFRVESGDLNTVGSKICISSECFYLISNDGTYINMLSIYNINTNESAMQSSSATTKSSVSFGAYWSNTVDEYPVYVYNENSNMYYYVEKYKNNLISLGANILEARLISYEELTSLGMLNNNSTLKTCNKYPEYCGTAPRWVIGYYVSGTATSGSNLFVVHADYGMIEATPTANSYGVRPVIKIAVSEFSN